MATRHPKPEINVTPLVDVVLVLLIIFMVIAPVAANEDRVLLPEAAHADEAKDEATAPWEVVLTLDGRFALDERVYDAAELRTELDRRKKDDGSRRVLLLADGRLPYRTVREAFAMLQATGFRGVSLKVLERAGEGA